jgi:hypothetical protein
MATMAKALLDKRGQTVKIVRSGDTIDPVTGDVTEGVDTVYKPKGVLTNYNDADIDGTRIVKGDRLLILDATTEPKTSDKPIINGAEWTVVAIESINPAGTPVAYKVQVRG